MIQSMYIRSHGTKCEKLRHGAHEAMQESQIPMSLEWGGVTEKQESIQHFTLFPARSMDMYQGIYKSDPESSGVS